MADDDFAGVLASATTVERKAIGPLSADPQKTWRITLLSVKGRLPFSSPLTWREDMDPFINFAGLPCLLFVSEKIETHLSF
jgi:hypothetical protein